MLVSQHQDAAVLTFLPADLLKSWSREVHLSAAEISWSLSLAPLVTGESRAAQTENTQTTMGGISVHQGRDASSRYTRFLRNR